MGSPVPLGRKREEARTTDDDGRISSKLTNFLLGQNICCTVPLNSGTMNISIHARRCWSDQSLANLPLLQFVQCPSLPANRNRERGRANGLKKPSFIHSLLSRSPSLSLLPPPLPIHSGSPLLERRDCGGGGATEGGSSCYPPPPFFCRPPRKLLLAPKKSVWGHRQVQQKGAKNINVFSCARGKRKGTRKIFLIVVPLLFKFLWRLQPSTCLGGEGEAATTH